MSDLDELWENIEPHVAWADHLALILLFASHPSGVDELRRRVEALLAADGRTLRVLVPRDVDELGEVTRGVAVRRAPDVGAVWVELWRGSGNAAWDQCLVGQLGHMNEVRSLIARNLGRPWVLVLPTTLHGSLYLMAPDLWTIRSFTAEVPSPVVATRGSVRRLPEVPDIISIGPPSAAEREWARLMAFEDTGGRVDPWDGLRAVEAAIERGSFASARAISQETWALAEQVMAMDAENPKARRDLSLSLEKLGDVEMAASNLSAARSHYHRSLEGFEALAKADPHNAQASFDVVDLHLFLVTLAERMGDSGALEHHLRAASERMRELDASGHVTGYRQREAARDRIAQLERELGS